MTSLNFECPYSVLGLDLSLTCTGVAFFQPGQEPVLDTITTKGAQKESLEERADRQEYILDKIEQFLSSTIKYLVVVEGPAFSKTVGKAWDRAGLWWGVVQRCFAYKHFVTEVPPPIRSVYATGRGMSGKDLVLAATIRRYPDLVEIEDNNVADAMVLASMGARALGYPLEDTYSKNNLKAMNRVDWSVLGDEYAEEQNLI